MMCTCATLREWTSIDGWDKQILGYNGRFQPDITIEIEAYSKRIEVAMLYLCESANSKSRKNLAQLMYLCLAFTDMETRWKSKKCHHNINAPKLH